MRQGKPHENAEAGHADIEGRILSDSCRDSSLEFRNEVRSNAGQGIGFDLKKPLLFASAIGVGLRLDFKASGWKPLQSTEESWLMSQ